GSTGTATFCFNNPNILDIGCGSARLLEQINSIGNYNLEYSGVDNSIGMLQEARKNYPNCEFIHSDMINISTNNKYNIITFIASFHHLNTLKDREDCLSNIYKIIENDGYIFMTNWALNSKINDEKYRDSIIDNSKNQFGSTDYIIKFGEYDRYYHCFDLKEIEYLSNKTGFKIIENKLFENNKNFITILQKK
ncbi:MAG: methyltransferase domain-containing protein, partial [Candidatus Gracilibacteria bacterium]|nr:methyltransferase domain-containing protein [Candidatus Gracilibacteria bacterium]